MLRDNKSVIIFCILCSFFFTNILLFSTNLPVQDDWNNIYLLQNFEKGIIHFLLVKENNHLQLLSRFFFLMNYYLFDFNYRFTYYLNFFFLTFLFYKTYIFFNLKNFFFFIILTSLLFSGRLFPIISQSFNIVWILSFIFFIYFLENYNAKKKFISIKVLSFIFLNVINFSLHICILLFLFINLLISKNKITDFVYICWHILIFLFLNFLSNSLVNDYNLLTSDKMDIKAILIEFNFIIFIFTLLSNLSSIYFPIIKNFAPLCFLLGLTQLILLFYFYIRSYKINLNNISLIFNKNSLLFLCIFASGIISIFRPLDSLEARFSLVSVFFQISFWFYFYAEVKKINLFKYLAIIFSLIIFVTGYFSPYLGIYWQIVMYNKNLLINECIKFNQTDVKKCSSIIYYHVFNGGTWFDKQRFNLVMLNLEKKKKIFFDEKYIN
jgi:hypothetical protein